MLWPVLFTPSGTAGGSDRFAGRNNAWTIPHVLTISDGGDTLNPHLEQSAAVANLSEMTMAWLLRWDEHNKPYPELATTVPTRANGGVSKDGLTITYHLRHRVKWSDAVPFDADDVVFSAYLAPIQALRGLRIFRQPSYAYSHLDFNVTHPAVGPRSTT